MAKQVELDLSTEWCMSYVIDIPEDWDINSERAREYAYEQITKITENELVDMFLSSLEGGLTIEHMEEI